MIIEEEDYPECILEIHEDNTIYLNGEQIVITYDSIETPENNVISAMSNVRYHDSDSGTASLYNVLGKTERVANIYLQAAIGGLTTTIVLGIIGRIVADVAFTASVATNLISVFSAYKTQYLSCVIRHYYRNGWVGGWNMGSFAEKIVTTWYPQVNYKGAPITTTHYRTGILY